MFIISKHAQRTSKDTCKLKVFVKFQTRVTNVNNVIKNCLPFSALIPTFFVLEQNHWISYLCSPISSSFFILYCYFRTSYFSSPISLFTFSFLLFWISHSCYNYTCMSFFQLLVQSRHDPSQSCRSFLYSSKQYYHRYWWIWSHRRFQQQSLSIQYSK